MLHFAFLQRKQYYEYYFNDLQANPHTKIPLPSTNYKIYRAYFKNKSNQNTKMSIERKPLTMPWTSQLRGISRLKRHVNYFLIKMFSVKSSSFCGAVIFLLFFDFATEYCLCSKYHLHHIQLPFVLFPRWPNINPCRIDITVPKHIRKLRDILLSS